MQRCCRTLMHGARGWAAVQHHPREVGIGTGAHPKVVAKAFKESLRFEKKTGKILSCHYWSDIPVRHTNKIERCGDSPAIVRPHL